MKTCPDCLSEIPDAATFCRFCGERVEGKACPLLCLQTNATATARPIRPFAGHELAVPAQNGIRRHDRRDLREQTATKAVSQFRQPSALAVVETQALRREAAFRIRFSSRRNAITSACSR